MRANIQLPCDGLPERVLLLLFCTAPKGFREFPDAFLARGCSKLHRSARIVSLIISIFLT